jgi:stage II sporulation protein D
VRAAVLFALAFPVVKMPVALVREVDGGFSRCLRQFYSHWRAVWWRCRSRWRARWTGGSRGARGSATRIGTPCGGDAGRVGARSGRRVLALRGAVIFALAVQLSAATLKVQVSGHVVEMPLEKYVAAALAGEAGVFRSDEALQAMAVVARTYGVRMRGRHAAEGFDLCATTHCQRIDANAASARLQRIADATAGQMLWYRGKLAFTPYSLDCGGRTEDVEGVWPDERAPYLKSRADEYCVRAGSSEWHWSGDPDAIALALRKQGLKTPARITGIRVVERTESGRARQLEMRGDGAVPIAAGALRFAIGRELGWNTLRSDWFDAQGTVFSGRGSGHGVGLCQRGADEMGTEGRGYREILAYYFPGTEAGVSARGFEWTRMSGEDIALYTTRPSQDGPVLAAAERALRGDLERTGWRAPHGIEVRMYPDAESFRDATGEPGWVAAYAHGPHIEMQPVPDVVKTLRHELFHLLIESQAAPGLPLWFREGLVEYLTAAPGRSTGAGRLPSDAELRETHDAARARRAYEEAAAAVAELGRHYGETALLRWVKNGIPSSASRAPVNSK